MKKSLVQSFVDGVNDEHNGERYSTIFRYFYPEFLTNLLLYSLPIVIDAVFIAYLRTTSGYAVVGQTNTFLHWIVKASEAFAVSTAIIAGQMNGSGNKLGAGKALTSAFWTSCFIGCSIGLILYAFAPWIFSFYGVSPEMLERGVAYLKLRAIGIVLMFVYQACIGFLRGIKNTTVPMATFVLGTIAFILFDYILIFGKFGFMPMGINGSALASIIQYGVATVAVVTYLLWGPYTRTYSLSLFSGFGSIAFIKNILVLSWPIILDKSALTWAYIWLAKMMNAMGTNVAAAFTTVQNMERFAFLPAIAFAQVITFLISNDIGAGNWKGIKSNIKKMVFASTGMVFAILLVFSFMTNRIVGLFDQTGDFTVLAAHVFPVISIFMLFDLVQLILAAALRGAANVKEIMVVRLVVIFMYFVPVSYWISQLSLREDIKFIVLYCSFYLGNMLMTMGYLYLFRSGRWQKLGVAK